MPRRETPEGGTPDPGKEEAEEDVRAISHDDVPKNILRRPDRKLEQNLLQRDVINAHRELEQTVRNVRSYLEQGQLADARREIQLAVMYRDELILKGSESDVRVSALELQVGLKERFGEVRKDGPLFKPLDTRLSAVVSALARATAEIRHSRFPAWVPAVISEGFGWYATDGWNKGIVEWTSIDALSEAIRFGLESRRTRAFGLQTLHENEGFDDEWYKKYMTEGHNMAEDILEMARASRGGEGNRPAPIRFRKALKELSGIEDGED